MDGVQEVLHFSRRSIVVGKHTIDKVMTENLPQSIVGALDAGAKSRWGGLPTGQLAVQGLQNIIHG